jgi:hypothetical protein
MFIPPIAAAPVIRAARPPAVIRYVSAASAPVDMICFWKSSNGRTIDLSQMCKMSSFSSGFSRGSGLRQPVVSAETGRRANQAPSNNWSNVRSNSADTPILTNPTTIKPLAPANSSPPNSSSTPTTNNQSAPTTSQSAPTTSQSAPTNNQSAPTNNQSAPTSNQSAPNTNQSTPTSNQSAPTNNQSTPTNQNNPSVPTQAPNNPG